MKLALLLGVSEYKDSKYNLPACEHDLRLMKELIELTDNYSDIYVIEASKPSEIIKNEIADWISRIDSNQLEEFFFYYTGHGEFHKNELYFQLHDYNESKRNTTTLKNSELDTWIRNLSPALAIKVVDACQSGVSYIKSGSDDFQKYINKSGDTFNKCIFMFSSQQNQSSYASPELSTFTKSFLDAVKNSESETIRYSYIMSAIADSFIENERQTPFFVDQCTYTEIFAEISEAIKNIEYPIHPDIISLPNGEANKNSLTKFIINESQKYVKEEYVSALLQKLRDDVNAYSLPKEFTDLYEFNIEFIASIHSIKDIVYVGTWLEENEHTYFAEPTYRIETYFDDFEQYVRGFPKERTRKVLDGFSLTFETPYSAITLHANPKYESLSPYFSAITFLISNLKIRFLYYYTDYLRTNWVSTKLNEDFKWKQKDGLLIESNQIDNLIDEIITGFIEEIMQNVKKNFDLDN